MIDVTTKDGITTIALNRPEAAHALSTELLYELHDALNNIRYSQETRVVIVTATGHKAFCAGADLKERATMTHEQVKKTVALIGHIVNEIAALPQPVIAALNGVAFGGGLELALACDIRFCADTAKLGLTETSLGIIPGAGGTQRLARLIGAAKAKELIFTARRLSAFEALHYGIVEYVVEPADLLFRAERLAKEIVANAPIAVQAAKAAINGGLEVDLATALQIEKLNYEKTIPTKDRLEGLLAFKEKRQPVYKGE